MSKKNIKRDHSDKTSFHSAYDEDFVDQEQCELLHHLWNFQTNMFVSTTPSRDNLVETAENDTTHAHQV